jgi:hypothetical protein
MDFNTSPYFDDFDEFKQFYRILFRPGVAVQAREMNQLQSILQNQVTKFGNHIFKDGSMVIPGQVSYNDRARYVKLGSTTLGGNSLSYLEGKEISVNIDGSGLRAFVITTIATDGVDPDTLIVSYVSGGQVLADGSNQTTGFKFSAGQQLFIVGEASLSVVVSEATSAVTPDYSAIAQINEGVYYLAGHFVSVPQSTVVVDKYVVDVANISYKIGIQYTESVVTENEDNTLIDNANGTLNYAAPGAHRYKIGTAFVKYELDADTEGFVELIRVLNGVVLKIQNRALYNVLEDTLARRTFDESGNYVVNNFRFDVREARKNNRGYWTGSTQYLVGDYVQESTAGRYFVCIKGGTSGGTEPSAFSSYDETSSITDSAGPVWRYTPAPVSNRGLYDPGATSAATRALANSSNLVLTFGPGKAYVKGYEIDTTTNSFLTLPKSRATASSANVTIQTPAGNYIYIDKARSFGMPNTRLGSQVFFFDRPIGGPADQFKFGYGRRTGQGRIKYVDYDPSGGLKFGLFDVKMEPEKFFDRNVVTIVQPDTSVSVLTKNYNISGSVRYAGGTSGFSFVQADGGVNYAAASAGNDFTVTGVSTAFNTQLRIGDQVCFGTSANLSKYLITNIINSSTMTLNGSSIAAMTVGLTSIHVRLPFQTVLGVGPAGTTAQTKFLSELRPGDTLRIGAATGIVVSITSENRLQLSSTSTTAQRDIAGGTTASTIAAVGTSGVQPEILYTAQTAAFASELFSNYNLGINAKRLSGLWTVTDFTGNATTVTSHAAIRLTGTLDGKLATEARVGDLISVNDQRLVLTFISSNSIGFAIRMDTSTVGSVTAQYPIFRINNVIEEAAADSLVFKVADSVQSMRNSVYQVYTTYAWTQTGTNSSLVFTLSAGQGGNNQDSLATSDPNYFIIARRDLSALSNPIGVQSVSTGAGGVVTVTSTGSFVNGGNYLMIYPVNRSSADVNSLGGRKTKTLVLDATTTYLTSSSAQKSTLTLDNTDIYRVNKVLMYSSFVAAWPATYTTADVQDITENYNFDDGQREIFYDYGTLTLKSGRPVPTGSVRVFYDYFSHSTGDYFAYNSYDNNFVPYEGSTKYRNQNLRDTLDFRPSITANDIEVPRYGTGFLTNVTYYLGRKDKVLLDQNGVFYTVSSPSSLNPVTPEVSNDNAVQLYDLELVPFTPDTGWPSLKTKKIDNKRYTMKDIGGIDKRLENLEVTTALSLLENKTSGLQIRDNLDPTLERYKTGFFVDNFGDATNADFTAGSKFSIDLDAQILTPHVYDDGFVLREKIAGVSPASTGDEISSIDGARTAAGSRYRVTGDLMTLDYTTTPLITQSVATTSLSVTPFLKLLFLNNVEVTPATDIYTTPIRIDNIVSEQTTNTQQEAVRTLRDTGDWRPYTISLNVVNTLLNSETVSELIPFCRANTILFKMKGMKPRAEHFVFFDDFDVGDRCQGAVKWSFVTLENLDTNTIRPNAGTAGEFGGYARWRSLAETYSVAGSTRTHYPADYDDKMPSTSYRDGTRKALNRGAVMIMYENNVEVGSGIIMHQDGTTVYCVNGRGKMSEKFIRANASANSGAGYNYSASTFRIGISTDNMRTLSNPTSVLPDNVCTGTAAGTFFSDDKGNLVVLFDLPDQDGARFISGQKPIVITDDVENSGDNWDSKATGNYTVEGFTVTTTNSYHSTKTFVANPYDPIAQSFKLPESFASGCFVTDVDFFFSEKPLVQQAPLRLEIRPCDLTGRPSGSEIIPGSVVTKYPDDITVDSTGQTPTKFVFDIPIYLLPDQYYAIALKSDCVYYKVWIATLGQFDINNPNKMHNSQTLLGSLFKSQDGEVWTEDQFSDIKFTLNRAVFNRDTVATAYVVNDAYPGQNIDSDPFIFVHSSNLVRVKHENHGFRNGDFVRFSSEFWKAQYENAIAANTTATFPGTNIDVSTIFGSTLLFDQVSNNDTSGRFQVSEVTLNTYVINIGATFVDLGAGSVLYPPSRGSGGNDIISYGNLQYHVAIPGGKILNFQETETRFEIDTVRGITYDSNPSSTDYGITNQITNVNTATIFDEPKVILSPINEGLKHPATSTYANGEAWQHSFVGKFILSSTSDQVSPVIDLSTLHVRTITHNVNNPTVRSRLYNNGSTLPAGNSAAAPTLVKNVITENNQAVFFDAASTSITGTAGTFSSVVPGSYITVAGNAPFNVNTSTGYLVTGVSQDGSQVFVSSNLINVGTGFNNTIVQYQDFIDEIGTSFGSLQNKYASKKINLANAAGQLKLILEACIPQEADFDLFYKIGPALSDFTLRPWRRFEQMPTIVKSTKRDDFSEITIDITDFDNQGNAKDLPTFTAFQIKIAMRTTNGAKLPQFRNLRVIAHA